MPSSQDGCVHVYVLAVLRNSMQAFLLLSFSPVSPLSPSFVPMPVSFMQDSPPSPAKLHQMQILH